MKHLIHILIALSLPCLALQCDKDDNGNTPPPDENKEQLPPATQSGKGTFGCKVNGEVWRPKNDDFNDGPISGSYGKSELLITANKETNKNDSINHLKQVITIHLSQEGNDLKTHKIDGSDYPENYAIFVNQTYLSQNNISECIYSTDSVVTGTLQLTRLDSVNNIVSGKFEFTAVNHTCGETDTIKVTEGRFDIKYAY